MKPALLRVVCAAITLASLAPAVRSGEAPWPVYTDPVYGFSISYPQNWARIPSSESWRPLYLAGPDSAGAKGLPLRVVVLTPNEPAPTDSFELLIEAKETWVEFARTHRTEVNILRTDRHDIQGLPALIWHATSRHASDGPIYQIHLATVLGRRYYQVEATTDSTSQRLNEEIALLYRIILTFRP